MSHRLLAAAVAVLILPSGCVSTPLRQIPPAIPEAGENVMDHAANGGDLYRFIANETVETLLGLFAPAIFPFWCLRAGKE